MILYVNAQSLGNKNLQLETYLKINSFINVLCVSEHWQKENELIALNISDFKLCSYFCRNGKAGGGVAIYVKNHIKTNLINIDVISKEVDFEIASVELIDLNMVICCLYRSPSSDFNVSHNNLDILLNNLYKTNKEIMVFGDFNTDFLTNTQNTVDLTNTVNSYGFRLLVHEPTRVTATTTTCLDKNQYAIK